MTTKMTRKELFTALLNLDEVKANAVWVEKLNAEIEAIDKKNANRKPTAQQIENESIKEQILTVLEIGHGRTVSEIMKMCDYDFKSNQQCTALLRQLRLDGKVTRTETNKGTFYFLADEEEA
jgi:hypothetical protein